MALYLSIPWRFYEVEDDHAHMAILRLLLAELLDNDNVTVELDGKPSYVESTLHPSLRTIEVVKDKQINDTLV